MCGGVQIYTELALELLGAALELANEGELIRMDNFVMAEFSQ